MGTIIFIAIVVGIIYLVVTSNNKKAEEKRRLDADYRDALASGNKSRALAAGRAYYGFIRKGPLTIYDEQAITNDLTAMG